MRNNKSILTLSGVRGDTRRYRSFHLYEQLLLAGVNCELSHTTDPELPEKISRSSIIIFHRTALDSYIEEMLVSNQNRGGLAILDVDDLVFYPPAFQWIDSPDFQDSVRASLYQEDMRRNKQTLLACHAVTASTDYLADRTRSMEMQTCVHRNAFSLEMLEHSEDAYQNRTQIPDSIVIGYASGTPTHDRDFDIAKPALKRVLEKYPQVELWLIGPLNPGDDWGGLSDRIKHHKWVPWRDLPKLLVQFDINIAPLVTDNPFAQSKSEIKYMEAGLVRVPTIASPTDAFQYAIQPGKNGFLAVDDRAWVETLTTLVEDPDIRKNTAERAYYDCLARYHPRVRAAQLIHTLDDIHHQVQGEPLWSGAELSAINETLNSQDHPRVLASDEFERKLTLSRMAIYTARHRGLGTLLKQLWIYFRRAASPVIPY